jgi:hypothetical protein
VGVLLGNGDGTFQTTSSGFSSSNGLGGVAAGDFNGDGLPDLAACIGGPVCPPDASKALPNDTVSVVRRLDQEVQARFMHQAGPKAET